ncbi:hypothetical protein PTSG_05493 [Salpingoeca rosetta]|uniref:Uncharacterized protein n=1 Tax=Salpingoeca rosetta (strain ATCC 50818 / BSB-021) TaxID=946362 RepID=F2UBD5_SALR5|nr:uncharacterized protein PTSG_05493 [Salpingoeca rosetta]EGD73801.1 hypothetical protein PTSG_05493 [Salpingoeca rosetta]|eukprot:XP_004993364.1 hypothetical protein PTSG_05493 [Salpingoeca rosetta]
MSLHIEGWGFLEDDSYVPYQGIEAMRTQSYEKLASSNCSLCRAVLIKRSLPRLDQLSQRMHAGALSPTAHIPREPPTSLSPPLTPVDDQFPALGEPSTADIDEFEDAFADVCEDSFYLQRANDNAGLDMSGLRVRSRRASLDERRALSPEPAPATTAAATSGDHRRDATMPVAGSPAPSTNEQKTPLLASLSQAPLSSTSPCSSVTGPLSDQPCDEGELDTVSGCAPTPPSLFNDHLRQSSSTRNVLGGTDAAFGHVNAALSFGAMGHEDQQRLLTCGFATSSANRRGVMDNNAAPGIYADLHAKATSQLGGGDRTYVDDNEQDDDDDDDDRNSLDSFSDDSPVSGNSLSDDPALMPTPTIADVMSDDVAFAARWSAKRSYADSLPASRRGSVCGRDAGMGDICGGKGFYSNRSNATDGDDDDDDVFEPPTKTSRPSTPCHVAEQTASVSRLSPTVMALV